MVESISFFSWKKKVIENNSQFIKLKALVAVLKVPLLEEVSLTDLSQGLEL